MQRLYTAGEEKEQMNWWVLEPANLYSETVLRKAKQLDIDEKLGLGKVSDPIASILQLKYKPEFAAIIREIGLDKFYVIYFSSEQLFLYKQFVRQTEKTGIFSIDATRSLIKSIKNPDDSTDFVFLYQAVVPYKTKILPVLQMISTKYDTNILTYWLREWLRADTSCPREVVTDYSFALLNAVALAFNSCDLNVYVENCVKILQNNDHINTVKCILRIDIAHLIKSVYRWKCFKDKHRRVKDFFVRCIGILSKTTTLESFKQICIDVLTVAFSETEDILNNDKFTCFKAQQWLLIMIKTKELQYEDNVDEYSGDIPDYESSSCLNNFIHDMEINSKKFITSGDRPNPYYCPNFAINLLRISKEFPLWTTVMTSNGTSVASSVKRRIFQWIKKFNF